MTFVFCQVGNTVFASIMVRSLRAQVPGATIIQCSDHDTPAVDGVNEVRRSDGSEHLMLFRMECFARVEEPAMFLDTDMICAAPIDPVEILGSHDVAVCKRVYNRNLYVRPRGYGVQIDLPEYRNKTYGEIYPYLGCVTITRDVAFWVDCYSRYLDLPEKFWGWFGDQEVIRDAVPAYNFLELPESRYACLIDVDRDPDPQIIHFKGKNRKPMMLDVAGKLGLLSQREKECLT